METYGVRLLSWKDVVKVDFPDCKRLRKANISGRESGDCVNFYSCNSKQCLQGNSADLMLLLLFQRQRTDSQSVRCSSVRLVGLFCPACALAFSNLTLGGKGGGNRLIADQKINLHEMQHLDGEYRRLLGGGGGGRGRGRSSISIQYPRMLCALLLLPFF